MVKLFGWVLGPYKAQDGSSGVWLVANGLLEGEVDHIYGNVKEGMFVPVRTDGCTSEELAIAELVTITGAWEGKAVNACVPGGSVAKEGAKEQYVRTDAIRHYRGTVIGFWYTSDNSGPTILVKEVVTGPADHKGTEQSFRMTDYTVQENYQGRTLEAGQSIEIAGMVSSSRRQYETMFYVVPAP